MALPDMIEPGVVRATIGIMARPGQGGRELVHRLVVERHEDGEPDRRAHRERGRRRAPAHDRVGEHGQRQERLGRAHQAQREDEGEERRSSDQPDDDGRAPGIARAAPGQGEQERNRGCHHQGGADEIELPRALMARQPAQPAVRHQRGGEPEGEVDPEHQRPVHVLGHDATEHRPERAGTDPDRAHVRLPAPAGARRDHVGEDRLRDRQDTATAEPLEAAPQDHRQHVGRERAHERAADEDADAGKHHGAAAMNIGQLAIERGDRRGGQKIGGDDPGEILEIGELASDRRHRGGHDRLIEGSEEHRQHQTDDDRAHFRVARHPVRTLAVRRGSGRSRPGGRVLCWLGLRRGRPIGAVGAFPGRRLRSIHQVQVRRFTALDTFAR